MEGIRGTDTMMAVMVVMEMAIRIERSTLECRIYYVETRAI